MSYYLAKRVEGSHGDAVARAWEVLSEEGFGVLTEIDVKATLKAKLDVDVPPYRILGACAPPYAHRALQAEPRVGLLLPCNVIVRETEDGTVEVAAIDPTFAMGGIENPELKTVAREVREKLARVIERI